MRDIQLSNLRFEDAAVTEAFAFFWSRPEEPYLARPRHDYALDGVVATCRNDYERVRAVCRWVHGLWQHDGDNDPDTDDPIAILEAVRRGERFRCVEYGIVINACLNALGIPSRVLGLRTAGCETRESGAGHVVTEAYLGARAKWIMLDGQWGVIPLLDGAPLNAVEFQRTLFLREPGLSLDGLTGPGAGAYLTWIAPYLCYFDVPFDHRVGVPDRSPNRLMLVPLGMKQPTVFQRKWPLENMTYTHSTAAFYTGP